MSQQSRTGRVTPFPVRCECCNGLTHSHSRRTPRRFCENCSKFRKYITAAHKALGPVCKDINHEDAFEFRKILFSMANSLSACMYSRRGPDGRFKK